MGFSCKCSLKPIHWKPLLTPVSYRSNCNLCAVFKPCYCAWRTQMTSSAWATVWTVDIIGSKLEGKRSQQRSNPWWAWINRASWPAYSCSGSRTRRNHEKKWRKKKYIKQKYIIYLQISPGSFCNFGVCLKIGSPIASDGTASSMFRLHISGSAMAFLLQRRLLNDGNWVHPNMFPPPKYGLNNPILRVPGFYGLASQLFRMRVAKSHGFWVGITSHGIIRFRWVPSGYVKIAIENGHL